MMATNVVLIKKLWALYRNIYWSFVVILIQSNLLFLREIQTSIQFPIWYHMIRLVFWYSGACGSSHEFIDREVLLPRMWRTERRVPTFQWLSLSRHSNFNVRHHDSINRYGISVSQINKYMVHLSHLPYKLHGHFLIHVTWIERRPPLVKQELLTTRKHIC